MIKTIKKTKKEAMKKSLFLYWVALDRKKIASKKSKASKYLTENISF